MDTIYKYHLSRSLQWIIYLIMCCHFTLQESTGSSPHMSYNETNIQEQLHNLTVMYEKMVVKMEMLEIENRRLDQTITEMNQFIKRLQENQNRTEFELDDVNNRLLYAVDETRILAKNLTHTNHKLHRVNERVSDVNETLLRLFDKVLDIDKHLSKVINDLNIKDSFVAYTRAHAVTVEEGGVVPFNHLLSNTGPGFDIKSHTYTCQHTGLYIFSTSIVNYFYWHKTGARIVKEGMPISASIHADIYAREWNQGSVTTVTSCRTGERVWVQCTYKSRIHGGDKHQSVTQFMGALIQIEIEDSHMNETT